MSQAKPLGGKVMTKPFMVMTVFVILALYFLAKRFMYGLGAVTNLSDGFPWGLWIVYDVVTGTALATGGYAMAILVYIFNRGQYHPLIRSAMLASVFGYSLAGFSIFIDVGRYWQLYNPFTPWYANTNSIMFEVATCIALYIIVLWIEFSPAILEGLKANKLLSKIRPILFFFIGLGVLLPTMHQSSLGTLLIIAGDKVNPLWQSTWVPLFFLLTAVTMGYGMVIFESMFASVNLRRPLETRLLAKLSALIPWILGVYLVVRLGDIFYRGVFMEIFHSGLAGYMFILEMLLFLFPVIALASEARRNQSRILFFSGVSTVLAGALYRFDAYLVGFNPGPGWHYFPSVGELVITLGIISFEVMAYLFFVKKMPILEPLKQS